MPTLTMFRTPLTVPLWLLGVNGETLATRSTSYLLKDTHYTALTGQFVYLNILPNSSLVTTATWGSLLQ